MKSEELTTSKNFPVQSTGSDPACACGVCGKEFEAYRRGVVIVTSICRDCLSDKCHPRRSTVSKHVKLQKDERSEGKVSNSIAIVFSGMDAELLQRIRELSKKERRSAEAQILHWLETFVPELYG
jgi:hypothetical protein